MTEPIRLTQEEIEQSNRLTVAWMQKSAGINGLKRDTPVEILGANNLYYIAHKLRERLTAVDKIGRPELFEELSLIDRYLQYLKGGGGEFTSALTLSALFPALRRRDVFNLNQPRVYVWVNGRYRLGRIEVDGTSYKTMIAIKCDNVFGTLVRPLFSTAFMTTNESYSLVEALQNNSLYIDLWVRNSYYPRRLNGMDMTARVPDLDQVKKALRRL